jgi:hypothetical protein
MKKVILALGVVFLFAACKKDVPQKQLTVNVTPEVGGSVTPSSGTYAMGSTVKLTATPSAEYIFKEWTGGFTGTTNPANVIMDVDKTVTAVFEKREYPLSLTIVGSGTVKEEVIKIASSATNYKSGTTVRLTPQPSVGFQFKKWSGDDTTSKTPLDLVVSKPINLTCTFEKMEISSLTIENPLDTLVLGRKYKYVVKGIYPNGTTIDLSDSVKITSSSKNAEISSNNITAIKSGDVKFQITYKNFNLTDDVFISSIEYISIPTYLSTPATNSQIVVPVIIINWIPSANGISVDSNVAKVGGNQDWGSVSKFGMSIQTVNQWILSNDLKVKFGIEEGSKFRGYSNPSATPYVGIKVVKYINIYEMPLIFPGDNIQGPNVLIPDYKSVFERINLKSLVESLGVKEVWINWTNSTGNIWIPESNMASPTTGDISNSYQRANDLPIYNKTYVVYGASFDRWFADMLHCRGHQIEAQMAYLNKDFFWQDFVGFPKGAPQPYSQGGRSGSTHFTPNSIADYDYANTTKILSDIGDWNPNNNGVKKLVNNETWTFSRPTPFQVPTVENHTKWNEQAKYVFGTDPQSGWLIYWFQSIPSNIPIKYSQNGIEKTIENWWDIYYNWDDAIKSNKKLFK